MSTLTFNIVRTLVMILLKVKAKLSAALITEQCSRMRVMLGAQMRVSTKAVSTIVAVLKPSLVFLVSNRENVLLMTNVAESNIFLLQW